MCVNLCLWHTNLEHYQEFQKETQTALDSAEDGTGEPRESSINPDRTRSNLDRHIVQKPPPKSSVRKPASAIDSKGKNQDKPRKVIKGNTYNGHNGFLANDLRNESPANVEVSDHTYVGNGGGLANNHSFHSESNVSVHDMGYYGDGGHALNGMRI